MKKLSGKVKWYSYQNGFYRSHDRFLMEISSIFICFLMKPSSVFMSSAGSQYVIQPKNTLSPTPITTTAMKYCNKKIILPPMCCTIPVLRLYGYCRRTGGVPGTIRSPRSRSGPLYPRVRSWGRALDIFRLLLTVQSSALLQPNNQFMH